MKYIVLCILLFIGHLAIGQVSSGIVGGGSADNLGNHTATQNLDLANNQIENISGTATIPAMNVQGMIRFAQTTLTNTATLDGTHNIVFADATSGNITTNLPNPATFEGWQYRIIRKDETANLVTISGTGLTKYLLANRFCIVVSDGTNWVLYQ